MKLIIGHCAVFTGLKGVSDFAIAAIAGLVFAEVRAMSIFLVWRSQPE
ncbi:MAG: hypothetical protein AAF222_12950 [Pseudomonadota bacterium]